MILELQDFSKKDKKYSKHKYINYSISIKTIIICLNINYKESKNANNKSG